jgi:hypothetical protein
MLRHATKMEAEKLCVEFGAGARERALKTAREAHRKHNQRLAKFSEHVARRIAIDTEMRQRGVR